MDRSSWGFGAKGRAGPRRPLWGGEKARRIRSRRRAGRAWGRHRHRCAAGPSSPRIPSASPTAGATPASGKAGAARQAGFWAGPAHLPGAKMMTTKGWRRPPTAAPGPAGGGPCAQAAQFSMTTVPKKQWPVGPRLGEHQQAPCGGRGAGRQAMRNPWLACAVWACAWRGGCVCAVGLRWVGRPRLGTGSHRAKLPRARCGSTLGGIVACSAQAYAGQGGCVRGVSPHWEGLTCIRRRTFWAGWPHFRHGLSPSLVVAYLTQVCSGKAASCSS